MTVTLVGEVANTCDGTGGFNQGGISGDDDFVQGTGALGAKISNTYQDFYTTTLGASAPYDFSVGGTEEGWHIIMWFGAKSPLDATAGQRIIAGNGTSRGEWYVPLKSGAEPKDAIFVSRAVDTARDFDNIAAGSWTLTGNPAQLSSVSQLGGGIQTTVSIMGSFNNGQIDQITTGLGCRVDGGTVGTPNTFETVRAQDEGTSKWGWWTSVAGGIYAKGKLFIGPETGSAVSVFDDTAFSVTFADDLVASGFYEIPIRGAGTDVTWSLGTKSAEDPAIARWAVNVDATANSFTDNSGVWIGGGTHVLAASATLTGTTMIDTDGVTQNGAALTGISVLDPNVASGVAFLTSDDPGLISGSRFVAGTAGHAIEITTPGTYAFDANIFENFGADGSLDAAIYNNSGGLVTINLTGGGTSPTIRNGTAATTIVQQTVSLTFSPVTAGSAITISDASDQTVLFDEAPTAGTDSVFNYNAATLGGILSNILIMRVGDEPFEVKGFPLPSASAPFPVSQSTDLVFNDP